MKPFNKIYLVDDDKVFLLTAQFSLKKVFPEAEILSFKSAQEAMDQLLKEQPDLLLLDLNMPVMDGWSFLADFAQSTGQETVGFPVYIVSSSIDPDDVKQADSNPMVSGFIEKPLDVKKVKEIAENG
jgi:CheY-like chemotaxis protein